MKIRQMIATAAKTGLMRSVNLVRSDVTRANSRYTSNWGLSRLSFYEDVQPETIINLAGRINSGSINVRQLYRFNPFVVAEVLPLTDLSKAAAVLSQASIGHYPFTFTATGRVIEKERTKTFGIRVVGEGTYEKPRTKRFLSFNLEFFRAVKLYASTWAGWDDLVSQIGQTNFLLAYSLRTLEERCIAAQEVLGPRNQLPIKVAVVGYR
ncbi:MAG: hypothetical protein WC527_08370 [Candidatus Margulisiibacteriota bacterium]